MEQIRISAERRGLDRTIAAGERAAASLRTAHETLEDARGRGFFDILGWGLFTGAEKHLRISRASRSLETAKTDVMVFERELRGVPGAVNLDADVCGFLSFADILFDNLIADYLIQPRIHDAASRVREMEQNVEGLLGKLRCYGKNNI